jgi:hypothetical protein
LRFRWTGGGALGSLGFRVLFGFGASVFVAELPFSVNETFGFLPGFFLAGGCTAAGTSEGLTVMLEVGCVDNSFANCADGEPGSGLDRGGVESSAELDRE